jgi:hypothetical protein
MSDDGDRLIAKAQDKLRGLEADVLKTKEFINQLREFEGQAPLYADLAVKSDTSLSNIRSDQFYGRPLATVVREILEMRRAAGQGAISVKELYAKLVDGGYKFESADEDNARRVLRISLTKNPAFHKIPNGDYGLSEWYPNAPRKKVRPEENNGTGAATAACESSCDSIPTESDSDEDRLPEDAELAHMKPR